MSNKNYYIIYNKLIILIKNIIKWSMINIITFLKNFQDELNFYNFFKIDIIKYK